MTGPAQYDAFAAGFEAHARDGVFNAYYDRPAVLGVLGDIAGRHVLDAGCGPGLYAEELLARGARVTGFDESEQMVQLARRRAPEADLRVARLGDPLPWLGDGSVDLAVMALVLHHVDDRVAALRELHRVLGPGGRLVLSTQHPTSDWLRQGGSYFEVREIEEAWSDWGLVRYWVQPLQRWVDEVAEAGFAVRRLVEPQPVPALREVDPERFTQLSTRPTFLILDLLALD